MKRNNKWNNWTGNGIEEESVKIKKLNQKIQKLMIDGQSEKMLQKFTVEIDIPIKKYVQLTEGIKKLEVMINNKTEWAFLKIKYYNLWFSLLYIYIFEKALL